MTIASRDNDDNEQGVSKSGSENHELSPLENPLQPDGGWGWVVCLASMVCYGTIGSLTNVFSILYIAIMEDWHEDGNGEDSNISSKTAMIGSLCYGINCITCPLASVISGKIGIRRTGVAGAIIASVGMVSSALAHYPALMYFTYSFLVGVGCGCMYSNSYVILTHYFKRRLGLATGLYYISVPLVTIAFTLSLPSLLDTIGLRRTLLVLSCIMMLMIVSTLTWKPILSKTHCQDSEAASAQPQDVTDGKTSKPNLCSNYLDYDIWRNRNYVLWVVSRSVTMFGYFVPLVHVVKFSKDEFPEHDGSKLVLYIYIASGVFRFAMAKMTDFPWANLVRMNQVALLALAVSFFCLPLTQSFGGLVAVCIVMGACDGTVYCLQGPTTTRIVGQDSVSQGYGFLLGIMSVPLIFGPALAGFLYDRLGNYTLAFELAGCFPLIGLLMMFPIKLLN